LYANGADEVNKWTSAVDDSGYASETAATRLDNLAGDWEGLTGSIETALIGMGEGADTPLRTLTQKLTGVVNVFNDLPAGAKNATLAIAGGGGLALLGIAALGKLAVSLASTRTALVSMGLQRQHVNALAGGLGRMAGAAVGIVAVATAAGSLVDVLKSGEAVRGANEITKSVEALAASGNIEDINAQFQDFGKILGANVSDVDSVGSALDQMLDKSFTDKFASVIDALPGSTSYIEVVEDRFKSLDQTLANMASGGNADKAASAFDAIEAAATAQGYTVEQLMTLFPQYKDALIGVAKEADNTAVATDTNASAVDTLAASTTAGTDSAEEYVDALKEVVDAQVEASGVVLSERDARRQYQQSIDDATQALRDAAGVTDKMYDKQGKLTEQGKKLVEQYKKSGDALDITTQKGRDNQDALDGIASSGNDVLKSMEENGATQEELQKALKATRDDFVDQAQKMGLSKKEAKKLADQLGLIPGKVDVEVAVNTSRAKQQLDDLIRKAGSLGGALVQATGGTPNRAPGVELPRNAEGGPITGPGTGTSDSVAALLSNGEHVWTAAEVKRAGGHGVVARMRAAAMGGLLRFASGGPVVRGHSLEYWQERTATALELTQMQIRVRDLNADLKETRKTKKGKTVQVLTGLDRRQAQQELAQARKELADARTANQINKSNRGTIAHRIREDERADEQAKKKKDAAADAAAARAEAAAARRDLSTRVRRGDIRGSVSSSLDSAYSVVDEVREAARGKKKGKERDDLNKVAGDAERALKGLYAQAKAIDDELTDAVADVDKLANIKASTSSVLAGGFGIESALNTAKTAASDGKGNVWYEGGGKASGKDILNAASGYAAKVKTFAGKISQLQKRGFAGVILQEVAALGVEQGTIAADALLQLNATDTTAMNTAYTNIQDASDLAGEYVTQGFYDGGLAAAQGVVDGLKTQQTAIEAQIGTWGVALQNALLGSVGLKMDKKGNIVKKATGGWVTGGTNGVDSVPHLLMPGEFVVNATAAKGNAQALEWINGGGGGASRAGAGGGGGVNSAALAAAFSGMTFVLDVDGQPIRAVARVEATGVLNQAVRATRAGVRG
jgi:hypothetical protein